MTFDDFYNNLPVQLQRPKVKDFYEKIWDAGRENAFEAFLKKECPAGAYGAYTMFVPLDRLEDFLKHLSEFNKEVGVLDNGDGVGAKMGGKPKFEVIKGEKED
jgi:hypothetical protein